MTVTTVVDLPADLELLPRCTFPGCHARFDARQVGARRTGWLWPDSDSVEAHDHDAAIKGDPALADQLCRRVVEVEHPDMDGPLVIEFPASSDERACSVARGWAFHLMRDERMLSSARRVIERLPLRTP